MKKNAITAAIICIAVFLFCCKPYKNIPGGNAGREEIYNEISDYLNSAKGVMHNAPVNQTNVNPKTLTRDTTNNIPISAHTFKIPAIQKDIKPADEPVLTKKQERKALKELIKRKIVGENDDESNIGIAIGLLILYVVLGILIIVLLWYLIANSVRQSANGSSNGGSGSNSTGSGGSGSNSGCYVATMVYGSYDAPEVMVLRKFRDNTLSHSKAGRAFIRWYYNWSPGFVAKYNHLSWLHLIIKIVLNRLVKFLS